MEDSCTMAHIILCKLIVLFTICNLVLDRNVSRPNALVYLTDKIREQLDSENFACGIFVDLPKTFDSEFHGILIQ